MEVNDDGRHRSGRITGLSSAQAIRSRTHGMLIAIPSTAANPVKSGRICDSPCKPSDGRGAGTWITPGRAIAVALVDATDAPWKLWLSNAPPLYVYSMQATVRTHSDKPQRCDCRSIMSA